jgi:arylsulfatase A-like enzyme
MRVVIAICLAVCVTAPTWAAERPNIVWLSIEDASPHLGCYGDEHARTPNVDRFATQSILYENAFAPAPVCAPCRSSIITGVYATSLGTHHMRSNVKLPPEIRPFTKYLREAGYYCTNNKKEDYQFTAPEDTWDDSSGKAHWKNRTNSKQPFFAVFNFTGTHESHVRGDEPAYSRTVKSLGDGERHDPASLELPPYYPDTPMVREEWARYYNCMTAMDKWFALHLRQLDDAGLTDDTVVFFWSDHGVGLPRGKRWLYDSGLKVPLIVHVPEKWRKKLGDPPISASGARTDELVSLIDLPETVLNLAGLPIPSYMQGRAFLGPKLTPQREYVFAARDRMDERYDMSRCVRTKRYKLIYNFVTWRPWTQWVSYGEKCDTMRELRRLKAEGGLNEVQSLWLADTKPAMEIYDLQADPFELNNLIDDVFDTEGSEAKAIHDGFEGCRTEFWRIEHAIRDLGMLPESLLDDAESQFGSRYASFRQASTSEAFHDVFRQRVCASSYPEFLSRFVNYANQQFASNRKSQSVASKICEIESSLAMELMLEEGEVDQAILQKLVTEKLPTLLDSLENADSPWDRLHAANVIDLLPDFDAHAEEIRPVVERLRTKLKVEKSQSPANVSYPLGLVEQCVKRLSDRLKIE